MRDETPIPFPVRPFAYKGENLLGYVLRLGYVNGLHRAKHLFELLRLPYSLQHQMGSWDQNDEREVIQAVSISTAMCDLHSWRTHETNALRFPSSSNAAIRSSRILHPRVCVKCMQDSTPHLRWYWQSILISHCPIHDTRLISACPNEECARPLIWEPTILHACPHCRTRWADMDMTGKQFLTPSTRLESQIVLDLTNDLYPEPIFYEDLTRAMMLVARSFDFMYDRLDIVPQSPNLSKIINAAYWLIASVEFEIYYKNAKYLELGLICVFGNQAVASLDDFQFHSRLALGAYGSEQIDPDRNMDLLSFEDPAFISKRRQCACSPGRGNARFHLDGEALSILLGGTAEVVPTLMAENALTPIYNTRADRDQIFDASELMALAMHCLADAIPEDYLAVHPNSPSLQEHSNNYARVLSWVLTGQLKGYLHPDTGFTKLYVDPLPFTILSRRHLGLICNDPVPLELATKVLRIDEEEVIALVKQGKIPTARYSRSDWILDGPKFYRYVISIRVQRGAAVRRASLPNYPSF
ncbi:MAG: hypothetical protein GYB21_09015 [Oceanospirillales bacterium]|nr:hypothetical protein [Oceanospirillales bacterium]